MSYQRSCSPALRFEGSDSAKLEAQVSKQVVTRMNQFREKAMYLEVKALS